jgi:hypothetical protein
MMPHTDGITLTATSFFPKPIWDTFLHSRLILKVKSQALLVAWLFRHRIAGNFKPEKSVLPDYARQYRRRA